jgi:hypothetical protein
MSGAAAAAVNETCGWSPNYVSKFLGPQDIVGEVTADCGPDPVGYEFNGCIQHSHGSSGPWYDDADSCGTYYEGDALSSRAYYLHGCLVPGLMWWYRMHASTEVYWLGEWYSLYGGVVGGPPSYYNC